MKINTAANLLAASAAALWSTASVHAEGNCETIVEIAIGNPDFEILVEAVVAADLVDTLSGNGPFTVFAPTDAAFEDLGSSVLDPLLNRPKNKAALQDILLYHVIPGEIYASDLEDGICVETANGDEVYITLNPGRVNQANIIAFDIEACNGVIHVIDAVLLPPENGKCPRPGKPSAKPGSKPSPKPGSTPYSKPAGKKGPSPGPGGKKAPMPTKPASKPSPGGKKDPSPGGKPKAKKDGKKDPSPGGKPKAKKDDGKKDPSPGGKPKAKKDDGKKDPSPGGKPKAKKDDGKKDPSPGGKPKAKKDDGKKDPSPGGKPKAKKDDGKKDPSPGGKPEGKKL